MEESKDEYVLELATRTLGNTGEEWEELYDVYKNSTGEKSAITNTSTYKTALAAMLYENDKNKWFKNSKYRFHVKSINYNKEGNEETPFQYIADIVCSYMLRSFQENFGIDGKTKINKITSEGLTKLVKEEGIQVRIYDECDAIFREMIDAVQRTDIVTYYAKYYEMEISAAKYKDYYLKNWLPGLEKYFEEMIKASAIYKKELLGKIP